MLVDVSKAAVDCSKVIVDPLLGTKSLEKVSLRMSNAVPLDENDLYILFKEFEDVFLFEKDTNKELWRVSMQGEAQCGIIGLVEEWALAGGELLIVWRDDEPQILDDPELRWIHDLRQVGDYEVEILIDPWSSQSAIWRLDIKSLSKSKMRDFKDYEDKEYTEKVIW